MYRFFYVFKRSLIMKKLVIALVFLISLCGLNGLCMAVNQTVTFEVQAINELSVSGNPGALIINSANAGFEPIEVTDSSTNYGITTNGINKKITGEINSNMPANCALKISMAAPAGGVSTGHTVLSTIASELVTGISGLAESAKTITYSFSATIAAGLISSDSRTVTLTLTDGT